MRQHRDHTNMAFPAAEPLMQAGFADDLFPIQHEQRQIVPEIGVPAPFVEQPAFGDRLFDEQPFFLRHGEDKFVQPRGVTLAQWSHDAFGAVTQFRVERKLFQRIVQYHRVPFVIYSHSNIQ